MRKRDRYIILVYFCRLQRGKGPKSLYMKLYEMIDAQDSAMALSFACVQPVETFAGGFGIDICMIPLNFYRCTYIAIIR